MCLVSVSWSRSLFSTIVISCVDIIYLFFRALFFSLRFFLRCFTVCVESQSTVYRKVCSVGIVASRHLDWCQRKQLTLWKMGEVLAFQKIKSTNWCPVFFFFFLIQSDYWWDGKQLLELPVFHITQMQIFTFSSRSLFHTYRSRNIIWHQLIVAFFFLSLLISVAVASLGHTIQFGYVVEFIILLW